MKNKTIVLKRDGVVSDIRGRNVHFRSGDLFEVLSSDKYTLCVSDVIDCDKFELSIYDQGHLWDYSQED